MQGWVETPGLGVVLSLQGTLPLGELQDGLKVLHTMFLQLLVSL
jgi:hypothetical protein